jgi:hypothetical protein
MRAVTRCRVELAVLVVGLGVFLLGMVMLGLPLTVREDEVWPVRCLLVGVALIGAMVGYGLLALLTRWLDKKIDDTLNDLLR